MMHSHHLLSVFRFFYQSWRPLSKNFWFFMILCWALGVTKGNNNADAPDSLNLYAQNGVVCPEPGHLWIATGDVMLKRGAMVIQADRIDLEFEPQQRNNLKPENLQQSTDQSKKINGKINLEKHTIPILRPILSGPVCRVTALGHVRIHHPSLSLSAPRAQYDFKTERMDAWGPDIVLSQKHSQKTPTKSPWVLNCSTSLSYTQATGMLYANGKVRLIRQDQGLESDCLYAFFGAKSNSRRIRPRKTTLSALVNTDQRSLDRENGPLQLVWARSDVKVRFWDKSKKIVALGQSALWNAVAETAKMTGNVHIRYKDQYVHAHQANLDFSSHTIGITSKICGTVGQWHHTDWNAIHKGIHTGAKHTEKKPWNATNLVYALIPTDSFAEKRIQ